NVLHSFKESAMITSYFGDHYSIYESSKSGDDYQWNLYYRERRHWAGKCNQYIPDVQNKIRKFDNFLLVQALALGIGLAGFLFLDVYYPVLIIGNACFKNDMPCIKGEGE